MGEIHNNLNYQDTLDLYKKLIKKIQNNQDPNEEKNYYDKIKCVVCGSKYIRKNKSIHDKTKRHRIKLIDQFDDFLSQLIVK